MIVVNFSHPLTPDQLAAIERLAQQPVTDLIEQMAEFDLDQSIAEQVVSLVDGLGLSPQKWQQETPLIVLPSLNFGAAAVLAELHGRCGDFPPIVRTRPLPDSVLMRYEVAEIINLKAMRAAARKRRQ